MDRDGVSSVDAAAGIDTESFVDDAKFGRLRLSWDGVQWVWRGRYLMRPAAAQVDVVLEAGTPPQPPSGDQRLFVDVLEEAFGILLACVLPPLKRAHRHYVGRPDVLRSMLQELSLIELRVPADPCTQDVRYELRYRCESDPSLSFVAMVNGQLHSLPVVRVRVDRA